ncbi:hypothetical protein V1508DRAFT_465003 [Lipomyces doorenjongii]|uniref:uncharacterized protein n=1 Tax=Lipomyces doorenjongii TaxID=383834 RepID=UPI0034CF3B6C
MTRQNVVAVARGPIVYCLEDVDNPWVTDHFRTLGLSESATFTPIVAENGTVFLKAEKAGVILTPEFAKYDVANATWNLNVETNGEKERREQRTLVDLVFIPYYYRANRGGSGQMRVPLIRV